MMQPAEGRPLPAAALQRAFDQAKDWARFAPNVWIVATNLTTQDWFNRLRPLLHPEDNILIYRLDPSDRIGWASKPIIEFDGRDHDIRDGF
jgi:hypothetical protein